MTLYNRNPVGLHRRMQGWHWFSWRLNIEKIQRMTLHDEKLVGVAVRWILLFDFIVYKACFCSLFFHHYQVILTQSNILGTFNSFAIKPKSSFNQSIQIHLNFQNADLPNLYRRGLPCGFGSSRSRSCFHSRYGYTSLHRCGCQLHTVNSLWQPGAYNQYVHFVLVNSSHSIRWNAFPFNYLLFITFGNAGLVAICWQFHYR